MTKPVKKYLYWGCKKFEGHVFKTSNGKIPCKCPFCDTKHIRGITENWYNIMLYNPDVAFKRWQLDNDYWKPDAKTVFMAVTYGLPVVEKDAPLDLNKCLEDARLLTYLDENIIGGEMDVEDIR